MRTPKSWAYLFLTATFALCTTLPAIADEPSPTEELESKLRDEIERATIMDPALQGVALRGIAQNDEAKSYTLQVILDSQPEIAKRQVARLKEVAKKVLRSVKLEEPEVVGTVPFRHFVDQVKLEVELTPGLAGASLEGAYFATDGSDELFVFPIGYVTTDNQRILLTDLVNAEIQKLFDGTQLSNVKAKTKPEQGPSTIGKSKPSEPTASHCFNLAFADFVSRDYPGAYRSFTESHLNSPTRTDIQYWRVLSLIGCGREADAKRILQGLADTGKIKGAVPNDAEVYRRLELVQGPLRWKLMAMENAILCKKCQ